MNIREDILSNAQRYIDAYGLDCSPEELFIQFQKIANLHQEFEEYLKTTPDYQRLNTMKRSEQMIEKRRLFAQWYSLNNQNSMILKEIISDLTEMTFSSERTVYYDLFTATTA